MVARTLNSLRSLGLTLFQWRDFQTERNRLGSRFCVNETSQISERYSVQMKATMKKDW